MTIPRQIIIDLVEGDDAPFLQVRFEGLDLDDYSAIKMKIKTDDARRFERDVVPVGPSDSELGVVDWQSGDIYSGQHQAEFELIQKSNSKRLTLPRQRPIILNVRKDLG